jgi:hypothetical protein
MTCGSPANQQPIPIMKMHLAPIAALVVGALLSACTSAPMLKFPTGENRVPVNAKATPSVRPASGAVSGVDAE